MHHDRSDCLYIRIFITSGDEVKKKTIRVSMATVGILHEYSDGEDWADFVERLDQYFLANNMVAVGDAVRLRAVLLTVCGQKVYVTVEILRPPYNC